MPASVTPRERCSAREFGSVLVATEPPGIVTDRDLRGRVLAANLGPETPVMQVMTRPLKTIESDRLAFSALRLMVDENVHHLPVVEEGKIVGVISSTDLLFDQTQNPVYLRGVIDSLDEHATLDSYAVTIGDLANTLFQRPGRPADRPDHFEPQRRSRQEAGAACRDEDGSRAGSLCLDRFRLGGPARANLTYRPGQRACIRRKQRGSRVFSGIVETSCRWTD